jgi:hypothetical protein
MILIFSALVLFGNLTQPTPVLAKAYSITGAIPESSFRIRRLLSTESLL